jgi:hypothetical protein
MESAVWGWILLGIAIGYLLNNRCCEKSIKNPGEQNPFARPPFGPLTIPVTRLKPITSPIEAPYDPNTNTSTIDRNYVCDIHLYFEETQIALGEILTLTSTPPGITYTNNQLNSGPDIQLYEISLRSVNSDNQNRATFKINVI